jgi:hypothetical protein
MKTKYLYFPLIIFIAFLAMEICNALYYFRFAPEQLAVIVSTVVMSVIAATALLFFTCAVGIALTYVIVAITCIVGSKKFL